MAQHVMTRLVDDLDGSEAVATLSFSLDGQSYEIDLSEPHLVAIRQALEPFVTAARTVSGGRRSGAATPNRTAPDKTAPDKTAPDKTPTKTQPNKPSTNGTARKPAPEPSRDLNAAPFRQQDPDRPDDATPAGSKPGRAPLVADPFNPQAHRPRS